MPGLTRIPSLIRGLGEAASKAKPFYSAVDEALSSLPNKALGEQMVKELLKKGAKPQEIIDRKIDTALGAPIVQKTRTVNLKKPDAKGRTQIEEKYFEVTPSQKGEKAISRADVERAAAENPPPQIGEDLLKGDRPESDFRIESDTYMKVGNRLVEGPEQFYVVDNKTGKQVGGPYETYRDADNRLSVLTEGEARFQDQDLVIPGGENYREILIKLPGGEYEGTHYPKGTLAHARVSDRYTVTYTPEQAEEIGNRIAAGINVGNPNSLGSGAPGLAVKKGIITPLEAAQYSHYRGLRHVPLEGSVKKSLHIEEIQSDWHQTGRKKGYQLPEDERQALDARRAEIESLGSSATPEQRQEWADIANKLKQPEAVPDAPFKSTWHELVMKRLLDDAARNGYDRVVITPGAEQAKRYDLSKRIDTIQYGKNPDGTYDIGIFPKGQSEAMSQIGGYDTTKMTPQQIEEVVGKDIASKIMEGEGVRRGENITALSGLDLKVGEKGMTGFYDQMLPAFVNRYGEKTGLQMNLHTTPVDGKKYRIFQDENENPFSVVPEGGSRIVSRHPTREAAEAEMAELETKPMHSIDITPEFRASVMERGQPLYQVAPPAAIGAAAMQEEPPTEYQAGGIVKAAKLIAKAAQKANAVTPIKELIPKNILSSPKQVGTDVIGRPIFDWRGSTVSHFTDPISAKDIAESGYKIVGEGYYGPAVSFSHDVNYAKQFGDVETKAKINPLAKILNLNDPKDWDVWSQITKKSQPQAYKPTDKTWSDLLKEKGYHGVYDAGAGDLFIMDPSVVEYMPKSKGGTVSKDAMWMAVQNKQLRKRHA